MRRWMVLVFFLLSGAGFFAYQRYSATLPYEWSGTVHARTMDVGSKIGGRIQEIHVREGAMVQAAELLISLEPGDLPAQRLQALGQLSQAQAALDRIVNQKLPTARQAEIHAARSRLDAQQIALEKAKLDKDRMSKLMAGGAASREDKENADNNFRNIEAQVGALSADLEQLMIGTSQDVQAAQGALDIAKGRLQQIDVMIDELSIRAPRASRVEVLDLRPGDIIPANASAARLLEPEEMFVRIYVPETQLGHIRPGMEVPIYVDSFPDQAFTGEVEFVSDEGEYSPRNLQTADERANQVFATRIRIKNNLPDVLRAGMAAFVRLPRDHQK